MIIAQSKLSLRFLITQHLGFLAKRSVLELNSALCLSLDNLLIVRVLGTVCITEVLGRERCVFGTFFSLNLLTSTFASLFESCCLTVLLFLTTLGFDSAIDSQLAVLEPESLLLGQGILHLFHCGEHDVANAFANMSLGVADETHVFDFATVSELSPNFFFASNERQVSNKNGSGEILPWVDSSVSSTAGESLIELAILIFETFAAGINSEVFVLEKDLVELGLAACSISSFFVENIGILTIFIFAIFFLDNFGALGLFRLFGDADGAEPNFVNLSANSEKFLELLGRGGDRNVADKDCPALPLFLLENSLLIFFEVSNWGDASVDFGFVLHFLIFGEFLGGFRLGFFNIFLFLDLRSSLFNHRDDLLFDFLSHNLFL